MNTTFILTGGIGRVITSIPALEKYQRLNPNDDFKIIVHGWEQVFFSHPTLQQRVFGIHYKGNFENYIKNNRVVQPEPYHQFDFYNQRCNLAEAFDQIINNTNDHSDLNYNCLHLSDFEKVRIKDLINTFKKETKKNKLVVFQPFGSGLEMIGGQFVDRTNRSLFHEQYLKILRDVAKNATVVYASHKEVRHRLDNISISFDEYQPYIRTMIGLISECDYFIGICSVGQHIARSFNKNGLILMGATNEINFSYPNNLTIFRKKNSNPIYTPWRLSEVDCEFSDRMNEGIMKFTDEELNEISDIINSNLDEKITLNVMDEKIIDGQYN